MTKTLNNFYKIASFLLLFSLFFWDVSLVAETNKENVINLKVARESLGFILSYVDIRFIYLLSIFPILYYWKYFYRNPQTIKKYSYSLCNHIISLSHKYIFNFF